MRRRSLRFPETQAPIPCFSFFQRIIQVRLEVKGIWQKKPCKPSMRRKNQLIRR